MSESKSVPDNHGHAGAFLWLQLDPTHTALEGLPCGTSPEAALVFSPEAAAVCGPMPCPHELLCHLHHLERKW